MSPTPLTLGIAGTAKNTGKTTATICLLNHFNTRGIKLGLTSIGYDGESVDNVTGLPKPRLFVPEGTYVVTASRCLDISSAKLNVLETLPISTPLGKLVCGIVEREGLIVTAGPNQTRHLRTVREWLSTHDIELIFVDGALNRMVPMVETDGFILTTGASYKLDIDQISGDAKYLTRAFNRPYVFSEYRLTAENNIHYPKDLEEFDPYASKTVPSDDQNTVIWDKRGNILASTTSSLFEPGQLKPLSAAAKSAVGFYCPGLITSPCLKILPDLSFPPETAFVLENPVKILAGNEPGLIDVFLDRLQKKGIRALYRRSLPLLAITVNPFYPRFRYQTNDYEPAYIDRQALKQRVEDAVQIPVFDVVKDGCEELAKVVFPDAT